MKHLILAATLLVGTSSAKFEIKEAKPLRGILVDVAGATIPNAHLELRLGRKVIKEFTTNSDGRYDFGELAAGKYSIRDVNGAWCAPIVVCAESCELKSKSDPCWTTPIN